MQVKLEPGRLLFDDGNLAQAGYATSLVKEYNRSHIKAKKSRIKEWDYYYIGNDNFGVALTVADNSYMSLASISFIDLNNKTTITKDSIKLFSNGKLNLPSSSKTGDIVYKDKKCEISFLHQSGKRHIIASFRNFIEKKQFRCDFYLSETNRDSMVIATPFNKPKHFYYNQKINLMAVSGYAKIGDETYDFNTNSFAVLDWGRGVWTYKNTWYWASMSTTQRGKRIGFNLGYGFGDTKDATENMVFIDDRAYKLENVRFDIPIDPKGRDDYLKPWKFRSDDGSINLNFNPIVNRSAKMNLLFLSSKQNQVFGRFEGFITIEGRRIYIDNLIGFAEKVSNKW